MINVRLQIGDGEVLDTAEAYGLIYISADNFFAPPMKEFEVTTYPEEEGEHIYAKTVDDAFDYKVEWFIKADGSIGNANDVISKFNAQLYELADGVKTMKQVTFYNDYKQVKIVGIPSPISEASDFWRDKAGIQHDVVKVEWNIRVCKPSLCNFNLKSDD